MRGRLETTLDADLKPEHADSIVSVIDELDRVTAFLNTSLDVAEAKADALRLSPVRLDLDELIRSTVDFYEPSMSDRGLVLKVRSGGAIWVTADPVLLHRVIANLLDNELKHLPMHSRVWVDLRAVGQDAVVIVEDDGAGFDPEIVDHVFHRRVRGRASRGHGLGLAFVAAVIRVHGGTIEAKICPTGGACIRLALPRSGSTEQPAKVTFGDVSARLVSQ